MECCFGESVKGLGVRARRHPLPEGDGQDVLARVVAIGLPGGLRKLRLGVNIMAFRGTVFATGPRKRVNSILCVSVLRLAPATSLT